MCHGVENEFTCWTQCDTKGQSYDHDCETPVSDFQ